MEKVKHLKSLKGLDFFPDYQKWDFLPDYAILMRLEGSTIIRSIKKARGIREDKALEYNYADIDPDIVFNIIAKTTKGDTRGFIQKHLAERAGTTGEISFRKDRDGSLKGAGQFHSTRKDYLRLGMMIAEDWKSDTCIGRHLRDIEKTRYRRIYQDAPAGYTQIKIIVGFSGLIISI